jgi:hypothetical protein
MGREEMTQVAKKGEAALSLKLAGATFEEICDTLGYRTTAACRRDIAIALAENVADVDRETHRHLATMRLERLLRAIYPKAIDPKSPEQLPAGRLAKEYVHEIALLNGAQMPQEIVLHNPSNPELMAWIARMTVDQMPKVTEHNPFIIEGEIVEESTEDSTGE